jgi:hypothetical protein
MASRVEGKAPVNTGPLPFTQLNDRKNEERSVQDPPATSSAQVRTYVVLSPPVQTQRTKRVQFAPPTHQLRASAHAASVSRQRAPQPQEKAPSCTDQILKTAEKTEKAGICGCLGGALIRGAYGLCSLIPRSIGATLSCINVAVGTTGTLLCCSFSPCSKKAKKITKCCGTATLDGVTNFCMSIISASKTVVCGIPLYCGRICCRKKTTRLEKDTMRCLEKNVFRPCCKPTTSTSSPKNEQLAIVSYRSSKYMRVVREFSGAAAFAENMITATSRRTVTSLGFMSPEDLNKIKAEAQEGR